MTKNTSIESMLDRYVAENKEWDVAAQLIFIGPDKETTEPKALVHMVLMGDANLDQALNQIAGTLLQGKLADVYPADVEVTALVVRFEAFGITLEKRFLPELDEYLTNGGDIKDHPDHAEIAIWLAVGTDWVSAREVERESGKTYSHFQDARDGGSMPIDGRVVEAMRLLLGAIRYNARLRQAGA